MSPLKALGFLLVFLIPATLPAGAWLAAIGVPADLAAWFPLVALFVVLPLADYALGHDSANVPPEQERAFAQSRWFRGLTVMALPVQLGVLAWSGWWFVHADLGPAGLAGWLLSQGVVGGVLAINTRNAWRLEAARLRKLGLPALHWRNELIGWTAVWLALAGAMAAWLGPMGLAFFLLQGLFAAGSLEVINYIEHYGLERQRLPDGRYERTTHLHSWNSDYRLSNLMLFQLQRHSDHHAFPKRPYAILRHHEDSPQLPGGYAAMFVLALVPPLWFRVIHPRVEAFRERLAATAAA